MIHDTTQSGGSSSLNNRAKLEADKAAAERLAEFAKTFSLRAKNDPALRIAYAELEQLLRDRATSADIALGAEMSGV